MVTVAKLVAQLQMDDSDFKRGESSAKRSMSEMDRSAKASAASIKASVQGASLQVDKMAASYQTAAAAQKSAAVKAADAQRQYNTVLRQSSATASEVAAAEARFAAARARVATTNVRVRETAASLAAAQRKAAADTNELTRATEAQGSTMATAVTRARGLVLAAGAGFGATEMVAFLRNAVMAASDLEESANGVNVIFGSAAKTVFDFASGASKSIGMSSLAAREAATSFGAYAKIAGLSGNESAKFAVKMTKLAGDMASFKNTSPEEAIQSIGAAFRGESDPIEKYNVILNESVLKNRALKDGLISNTSEALAPAVRVQAAYNEILAQTSHMQGDFEKTSGSLSNRLKTLKAEFFEKSAVIGQKLIPVAQALVTLLSGPGMAALSGFGDALGVVGTMASAVGRIFGSLPAPLQLAVAGIVAAKLASAALGSEVGGKLVDRLKTGATAVGVYGIQARETATGIRQNLAQAFASAGGNVDGFGNKVRAAGTMGFSAFRAGASGLMGLLGGPWGLALTGATLAIGAWANKTAESKARTQELEGATTKVAQALNTSKGAYSEVGAEAARATLEQVKMTDGVETLGAAFERLGLSSRSAAAGLAGNKRELADTKRQLAELAEEERRTNAERIQGQGFGSTAIGQLINFGGARDKANERQKLEAEYQEMEAAIKRQQESLQRQAAAGGDVVFSASGTAAIGAMASAMEKFKENTDGAAAGVKILSSALDQLMTDQLTVEDAMVAWNDGVQKLADAARGVNAPLFEMNGQLNSANESVRNFYGASKDAASNIHEVAAATYQQTGSLQAVKDAVTPLYDSFVQMATAAGIPQPEIDKLIGKLGIIPTDIAISVSDNFPNKTALAEALRGKIVEIPNEKTIVVNDNSPEIIEKMRSLGYEVKALPGGRIEVTTNAPAAGAEIDAQANKPRTATVDVIPRYNSEAWRATGTSDSAGHAVGNFYGADGGLYGTGSPSHPLYLAKYANGKLPAEALIAAGRGRGLIQWAEGETGGEAFIPLGLSKRARSLAILAETARRMGMDVVSAAAAKVLKGGPQAKMANGGVVESMSGLVRTNFPELTITDSYRPGANDNHGAGRAIDVSNGSGNTDEQLRFANWVAENYPNSKELIYDDPRFGRQIKEGAFVGNDFYAGAGDHTNHVHWAMGSTPGEPGKANGRTAPDARTDRQKVADAIVAEGRRRGISDKGIKIALAAGLAESNLADLPDIPNSEYDSAGVFQQRPSMGWGPAGQGAAQDANDFYDRLTGLDYERMDPAAAAQSVQRSAFSDGSNYRAKLAEADAVFADVDARTKAAGAAPEPTRPDVQATAVDGQRVFVTNWPTTLGGAPEPKPVEERPARAKVLANFYANGGFEDHSPQVTNGIRVFGEPETGGEAYIPLGPSKRARSIQLWMETGRRLGVAAFGAGGFGGYSGPDTTDSMKPKNWYQGLALASGLAFTAVSGLSGIASMAASGNIDLSNLAPKFDTGNNSIPGLDRAFQSLTQQLDELIKAAHDGKPVNLQVDVDSSTGRADVAFMRGGLG